MSRRAADYREAYPTGYKHCSHSNCGRWRPVSDFQVREWTDHTCTVPRLLSSTCTTCQARLNRKRHGHSQRELYPHGAPGSAKHRAHTNARNRASARKRRRKKAYRDQLNEYHRIWRSAKGQPLRPARNPVQPGRNGSVPAADFLRWLDETLRIRKLTIADVCKKTGVDPTKIYAARRSGKIHIAHADALATALGRPDAIRTLITHQEEDKAA